MEEHLKKLGRGANEWGKNALGIDTGYQLAVEAWWKGLVRSPVMSIT